MKNLAFKCAVFCTFLAFQAQAQYDPSLIDKKAVASYNKGIELAQAGNYAQALNLLQEAVEKDKRYVDAYLSLAGVYGQLKNYPKSVEWYERSFALDSNYTSDFRLPYSINLAGNGQFEKALTTINALLSRPKLAENTRKAAEYRKKTYEFAVNFEKANQKPFVFTPVNLGDSINSHLSEYFPSQPVDGSVLFFTRRLPNQRDGNEDFFAAKKGNTSWRASSRLTGSINTPENEGAQIISQDGQWLVFAGCNRPDGMGSCDLYMSYQTNTGWSEALNLGEGINSDQWDSQPCLSPDKRDLYFASRRLGGYGGSDIYVSHRLPSGRWSEPENLGPAINTRGDESAPFIHADNQTLYFASTGLPGYGEEDLFLVRKKEDGAWGDPQNLGYPINTIGHEGTLFIASDAQTAYFASDRSDSRGGLDIYSFQLREGIRPIKTLWVKGNVFDAKTKQGLPSSVELIDLASNQVISRVQTDEAGNYLITLPVGKNYLFNVNRRGYLFYSDNYLLKGLSPDSTYEKNIPLQPIEVNAAITLKNVFFDFKKYDLKQESQAELDKAVQFLKDNPTVTVQIEGHTDVVGTAADNQKLSEQRARTVMNYLIVKGIKDKRITAKGFGATKPIASNKTDAGRALNRRTEMKIVSK